jgi:hypothetical protein
MWVSSAHKGRSIRVTFKNYLNTCNLNFESLDEYYFWIFSVLMWESDSCILQFLNKLNLTYQRLTSFVASFYSINSVGALGQVSIVSHSYQTISAFRDQISILIMGCVITRFTSPSFVNLSLLKFLLLILKHHLVLLPNHAFWSSWFFLKSFKSMFF